MENASKKKRILALLGIFLIPVILLVVLINSNKSPQPDTVGPLPNAFNDKLPSVNLKDSGKNKFEIYMKAQEDSAKRKEQVDQDPYTKRLPDLAPPSGEVTADVPSVTVVPQTQVPWQKSDVNERKVNERLNKIMSALNSQSAGYSSSPMTIPPESYYGKKESDIEKLGQLLSALQTGDTAPDPEMKQLETVLDKILDIQHPDRVKGRLEALKPLQDKDTTKNLFASQQATMLSSPFFSDQSASGTNAFWGLTTSISVVSDQQGSFLAVIHENQKIQEGQPVKLRLLENLFVSNTPIPKGHFLYAKASIADNRVQLHIQEITYQNKVYPVSLTVYDQTDGMEGVNIRGDMTEEITKNGVDQLIQQMQLNAMSNSIGVQAATSGIQTAKNLIGKKAKKVTITLKAGHGIILKSTQS